MLLACSLRYNYYYIVQKQPVTQVVFPEVVASVSSAPSATPCRADNHCPNCQIERRQPKIGAVEAAKSSRGVCHGCSSLHNLG